MEDDVRIGRVAIVTMAAPSGRVQIDFHVTNARRIVRELQDGVAEIRTGFVVPKTGVKNPDRLSVQSFQLVALQTLMLPDLLQQPFGRCVIGGFLQGGDW